MDQMIWTRERIAQLPRKKRCHDFMLPKFCKKVGFKEWVVSAISLEFSWDLAL